MAEDSDKFRLVDLATGGALEEILTDRRSQGHSPAEISRYLRDTYEVWISGETIRRWCRDRDIRKVEAS